VYYFFNNTFRVSQVLVPGIQVQVPVEIQPGKEYSLLTKITPPLQVSFRLLIVVVEFHDLK